MMPVTTLLLLFLALAFAAWILCAVYDANPKMQAVLHGVIHDHEVQFYPEFTEYAGTSLDYITHPALYACECGKAFPTIN